MLRRQSYHEEMGREYAVVVGKDLKERRLRALARPGLLLASVDTTDRPICQEERVSSEDSDSTYANLKSC